MKSHISMLQPEINVVFSVNKKLLPNKTSQVPLMYDDTALNLDCLNCANRRHCISQRMQIIASIIKLKKKM